MKRLTAGLAVTLLLLAGCSLNGTAKAPNGNGAQIVLDLSTASGIITDLEAAATALAGAGGLSPAKAAADSAILAKVGSAIDVLQTGVSAYLANPTASGKADLQAKIKALLAPAGPIDQALTTAQTDKLISAKAAGEDRLLLALISSVAQLFPGL